MYVHSRVQTFAIIARPPYFAQNAFCTIGKEVREKESECKVLFFPILDKFST